jgi:hypothetical protein
MSYTFQMISPMISELHDITPVLHMIYAFDISITLRDIKAIRYHRFYDISAYVMVFLLSALRGFGAPGARCSTASSHAIANMPGMCVQLNTVSSD